MPLLPFMNLPDQCEQLELRLTHKRCRRRPASRGSESELVSVRPGNAEETTTLLPTTDPEPEKRSSAHRPSLHLQAPQAQKERKEEKTSACEIYDVCMFLKEMYFKHCKHDHLQINRALLTPANQSRACQTVRLRLVQKKI